MACLSINKLRPTDRENTSQTVSFHEQSVLLSLSKDQLNLTSQQQFYNVFKNSFAAIFSSFGPEGQRILAGGGNHR